MATTRDIKRRIKGVKNIQQITKAMKMVAAAKLNRAQERMGAMRPYADGIESLLARFVGDLTGDEHPLLTTVPEPSKVLILTVASDRGLCGGFNTAVIRRTNQLIAEQGDRSVSLMTIGKRAGQFMKRTGHEIVARYDGIFDSLSYSICNAISDQLTERFADRSTEEVYLVYNEFKSILKQELTVKKLLPFDLDNLRELAGLADQSGSEPFIYEPSDRAVCRQLLPRYLSTQIYRALLESYASELASRMTAMESATSNAGDMIDSLTLSFNRARQAAITQEISEIVGGASALER